MQKDNRYTAIQRDHWAPFLELFSRMLTGQNVELEIAGLDVGDQIEIEWTSFDGLSYSPREDKIYLHTPDETHDIEGPREMIAFADTDGSWSMLTVQDSNGQVQIIRFREPLMLMPPEEQSSAEFYI